MIKKLILLTLLLANSLNAVNPASFIMEDTVPPNEHIVIDFTDMTARDDDWVGIYPDGSNNDWENVIAWEWTDDVIAGRLTFDALPIGNYEVRAFYHNSFNVEASKKFKVALENQATITSNKANYTVNEQIIVNFNNMAAKNDDWIGIYPEGSNNDWGNVLAWEWTNDITTGNLTFDALPAGTYEIRAFYNNSFNLEASKKFKVTDVAGGNQVTISSNKANYTVNEQIIVNFNNMAAKNNDWIGIYPEGSTNAFVNVVAWKWTDDITAGNLTFDALPAGSYEIRAFYNNSLKLEASKKIEVADANTGSDRILYDDAENGLDPRWVNYDNQRAVQLINTGAAGSAHSVRTTFPSGYYFLFGEPAKKLKFLELDMRIGNSSHNLNFGVKIRTKKGTRRIIFSAYMNHPGNDFSGLPPEKWDKPYLSSEGYQHNHPGPTDYYLATKNGTFIHYKINIDEKLKVLEPDNELLSIISFTTAGGDYDNLSLTAN